jgi:hypothetical protein
MCNAQAHVRFTPNSDRKSGHRARLALPQYTWDGRNEILHRGPSIRVIAEILAWNEDQVERIIRRYVSRSAATREAIRLLNSVTKERT